LLDGSAASDPARGEDRVGEHGVELEVKLDAGLAGPDLAGLALGEALAVDELVAAQAQHRSDNEFPGAEAVHSGLAGEAWLDALAVDQLVAVEAGEEDEGAFAVDDDLGRGAHAAAFVSVVHVAVDAFDRMDEGDADTVDKDRASRARIEDAGVGFDVDDIAGVAFGDFGNLRGFRDLGNLRDFGNFRGFWNLGGFWDFGNFRGFWCFRNLGYVGRFRDLRSLGRCRSLWGGRCFRGSWCLGSFRSCGGSWRLGSFRLWGWGCFFGRCFWRVGGGDVDGDGLLGGVGLAGASADDIGQGADGGDECDDEGCDDGLRLHEGSFGGKGYALTLTIVSASICSCRDSGRVTLVGELCRRDHLGPR